MFTFPWQDRENEAQEQNGPQAQGRAVGDWIMLGLFSEGKRWAISGIRECQNSAPVAKLREILECAKVYKRGIRRCHGAQVA